MAYAMRMTFVDVICKDSLRNIYAKGEKIGYEFDIRLGYYRGHFLSCIDEFSVTVDGEIAKEETVTFCLNGKEFAPNQLKECFAEFWNITTPAKIKVLKKAGLATGEHELKLELMLRIPYMAIGDNHQYMPLDSGDQAVMEVND